MTYKVPEGWEEVKLGEAILVNPRESLDKVNKYKKVSMGDVKEHTKKISGYELERYNGGAKFRNGDTLFARITPCLENGKISYVDILEENEIAFGSTEFLVLREKKNVTLNDYIYYLVKSPEIVDISIKSMVGSSGRQRVQNDVFKNITFNLPPLQEQKAIANTLSAIDDKIELNNKINQNLEAQAQAIFKSWFIDFEPFQDGEFVESELGMIPKGWEVVKLEEVSTVQNGFAFKSKDYISAGCPVIRTLNINNNFVNTENLEYLPIEFYESEKYEKYSLEKFDTLLVMVGATIGKIGMILDNNIPALQNQNMWRFRPLFDNISPFYIHYQVHKINKEVSGWDSGSARSFYRKGIFQDAKIALPKKEIMARFHNITSRMFEIINIKQQQNQKLSQLRDTLLPKLISGEIRIPLDK